MNVKAGMLSAWKRAKVKRTFVSIVQLKVLMFLLFNGKLKNVSHKEKTHNKDHLFITIMLTIRFNLLTLLNDALGIIN